jgi:trk system potassium uptake protein TrkA
MLECTNNSRYRESQTTHFVLGDTHTGVAIAEQLQMNGHSVTMITKTHGSDIVPVIQGSPTDVELLIESGLETATSVIIGAQSDARNLLIAQLIRVHFDIPQTTVLVYNPERLSAVAEAGHEALCVTTVLSETVAEHV